MFREECSTLPFILALGRWARGSGTSLATLHPRPLRIVTWTPGSWFLSIRILKFVFVFITSALPARTR